MNHKSADRQSSPATEKTKNSPGITKGTLQTSPHLLLQRAQADPSSLTRADVLRLQRSIGNRATGRLLASSSPVQTQVQASPAQETGEQQTDATQTVTPESAPPVTVQRDLAEGALQAQREAYLSQSTPLSGSAPAKRTFGVPSVQRDPNDDLRAALRKRRGMVTGQSEEDVAKENGLEDFLGSVGKRETEETQKLTGTITPEGRMAAANAMGIKQEGGPGGVGGAILGHKRRIAQQEEVGQLTNTITPEGRMAAENATGIKQENGPGGVGGAILGHKRRIAEQEEAENVQGDPYVDRIRLGDLVSTRGKLGAQGFNTLLNEQRQRESSRKWSDVSGGSPLLDEHRQDRNALDKSITDFGEAKRLKAEAISHAQTQHGMLNTMFETALNLAKSAAKTASWDKAALINLTKAAKNAVAAVKTPEPDKIDDVAPRATLAQNAIGALNVRAKQDVEWMESLKPYDEATIKDGLVKMAEGDKSIMNNNMSINWNYIVTHGSVDPRDDGAIAVKFIDLLKEIDRKTPFDAEVAKTRMTGSQSKRDMVMQELIARTSAKRSIMDIIKVEPSAVVLDKFVTKFTSLDNFDYVLAKTPNRSDLADIVDKANRDMPALRRIYQGLAGDPVKVKFMLVGDGGQKINFLDNWFQRGGKAWEGDTCTEPTYDPPTQTKEYIVANAVPKDGSSRPPNGGYAGNRVFGANTKPPDMLLPQWTITGTTFTPITYHEYDTKRFYSGVNRGAERFIKGSDGRFYYTDDHYHTFKKFA